MKLSSLWGLYEGDKRLLGYSPYTLKAYSLQFGLLVRGIGDLKVNEVDYVTLKDYLISQEHLKPSSLGHRVRFIKSFFKWVHEEGYIPNNPASRLREPKVGMRIPKPLSEEKLELLRDGCRSNLEHCLINIMFSTGCRIGEIVKINKRDIDWSSRSIIVLGKGNKEREVYFDIKTEIYLKRYLNNRNDDDNALFVTERKPHRMSVSQMRWIIKRIASRAGINDESVYPHKLRHSYATHLLDNGAPIEVIQSFMGHAKTETTQLYTQLSGERRREFYRRYF